MFLPLLTLLAENLSGTEIILHLVVNLVLFASLGILSVFLSSKTEKIIYSILFILTYLPFAIFTSYLLLARVLLRKNSIISLFETNPQESKEFMMHNFNPWIIVACVAYIFVCFLIIWMMRKNERLKVKDHRGVFFTTLVVALAILLIPILSHNVYFANFYSQFIRYKITLCSEEKGIAQRQSQVYQVSNLHTDAVPKTIVVVIGESLSRHHMSLYGYIRDTNPNLSKLGDSLFVYQDVVSPQVHTIPVMRSVLTFYERDYPKHITEKPSLFELFNRAGYETYFITNQTFGGELGTSYDALLEESQHVYNLSVEKLQDEIVLPTLQSIVDKPTNKNKLVLIHLVGNHMAYEFRYTPSFKVFDNEQDHKIDKTGFRNSQDIRTIDKYDNSVLYNDFVLAEIIKVLKQDKDSKMALVYFSDHGEEVFDYRKFSGHAYEKVSKYMCEVPFLVWLSPAFLQHRTDILLDTKRPYSTADFMFGISNIAGLEYLDYDSTRSVFSKDYTPSERFVGDYAYDEVKEFTP
jgi:heptose-I-phosphate ethanolaminephosphotransferase